MKAKLYSIDGKEVKDVSLPNQFAEEYREDLIRRAVLSEESKEKQPHGNYPYAGMESSAKYRGEKDAYGSLKNRGQAMLPREVRPEGGWGKVRLIPSSVKGRRAHPPKVEKVLVEKINKKEYMKAMRSALSATCNNSVVGKRCNIEKIKIPFIIENKFEKLNKNKEILSVLEKLNLVSFIEEAKNKTKRKTGVRKTRGKIIRKVPKYLLIIVGNDAGKAGKNLPGVDVVKVSELKVKHLSPGAYGSRITIYSENALKEIGEKL